MIAKAALALRMWELRVTAHRRSLAVLATALVCIGCTAPAAQVSQAPSDTAATASPSASAISPADAIGHA